MLSDREDGVSTRVGVAVKEVRRIEDDLRRAFTELRGATEKAANLDMHFHPTFGVEVEAAWKAWKQAQNITPNRELGRVFEVDEPVEAPIGERAA